MNKVFLVGRLAPYTPSLLILFLLNYYDYFIYHDHLSRTDVSFLTFACFAVFYRFFRTICDACHTMGAVTLPLRLFGSKFDIAQRALIGTEPASAAAVLCVELLVFNYERIIYLVHYAAHELSFDIRLLARNRLACLDMSCRLF